IDNAPIAAKLIILLKTASRNKVFLPKPKVDSLVNNASQAESEALGCSQPVALSVQSVIPGLTSDECKALFSLLQRSNLQNTNATAVDVSSANHIVGPSSGSST
ncbi:hypothetical protein A2U01_0053048, partial [Trifolium medium]|nr:hypothetical protein [Trifolium medium]